MFILGSLVVTCLFQVAFSQCGGSLGPTTAVPIGVGYGLGEFPMGPNAGYGGWGGPGYPGPYNSMGSYGGIGTADMAVVGEMPVAGSTVVVGQVPVVGNVRFAGEIPAGGIIAVSGSCSCGLNGAILN